ncbi:MAG: Uma2 family endonuclease [Peptococcaceae bacterium]|nr:Uma2 family endonuclease [Peptococcaceae bacterium]
MDGLLIKSDKRYTYDDYLKLNDGHNYEVIGGNLIMEPRPRPYHQKIVGVLDHLLRTFLQDDFRGEVYLDVDVVFGTQVASPDIVFVARDRLCIVGELNIKGAPDLVIEVLSPSTRSYDRRVKGQLFFENGVKEYWLVDPAQFSVEILSPGDGAWKRFGLYGKGDAVSSPLLSGLEVMVKDIFGLV